MSYNQKERHVSATNRQGSRGSAVSRPIGAHFSQLPADTQQAVLQGIFGACSKWLILTGAANPDGAKEAIDPGRKIAILRQVANLTQVELAKRAGVRQADVSRAEKDFYDVKLSTLEKILGALGTNIEGIRSTSLADIIE